MVLGGSGAAKGAGCFSTQFFSFFSVLLLQPPLLCLSVHGALVADREPSLRQAGFLSQRYTVRISDQLLMRIFKEQLRF